jgi:hypothetical protein
LEKRAEQFLPGSEGELGGVEGIRIPCPSWSSVIQIKSEPIKLQLSINVIT